MNQFDPNATGSPEGIFGLPFNEQEAQLVLIPVPWEVTTSYGSGTSLAPEAIFDASLQVDLFDLETGKPYEKGIYFLPIDKKLKAQNKVHKLLAKKIKSKLDQGKDLSKQDLQAQKKVNQACEQMCTWVYEQTKKQIENGKQIGLIGGDHSTPFGAIRAVSEAHSGDFGVLHIDAHADLRKAYQGFTYSHASIMYNVMSSKFKPKHLVQVGIRDFCEDEKNFIDARADITTFFDVHLKDAQIRGEGWDELCKKIIEKLPEKVFVSFDIDGLDPALCPHTGTPVPGGLSFTEATFLLKSLVQSKRKIVGFDLNEVVSTQNSEWDANVGARMLYKLCGWSLKS